ncbi:MAG: hypothetical protein IPP34_03890 [Bacteroidetes bacterium]|nr:hypothetical protein [Bacteroidota bacterium]
MEVKKTDQKTIDINMYKNIFFLLSSKAFAMMVPIGIEIKTGVRNATPMRPYLRQILTNLRFRGVNNFLCSP